jgi:two-component system CheB/CheR fusion protein
MNQHSYNVPVQVFATDIDSEAIDAARWGAYATGIAVDVSPDRLNRFFMKEEAAYRISREIREMVIFAVQSVIKDPPFSKLDMISCRNLLIYLDEPMQQQVLRLFHYSLKPGGFLFLGSSETRGKAEELFEPVDKKWKIFRRIGVDSARQNLTAFPQVASVGSAAVPSAAHPTLAPSTTGIGRALVEKKLLDNYTPAAALVDEHGEIAFLHGQTDPYLKPPQGESPFNILPMAREGLRQDLSLAMRKAARHKEPVVCEDLLVQKNGGQIRVRLTVEPVFEAGSGSQSWTGWLLVVLESRPNPPVPLPKAAGEDGAAPVPSPLEQELEATRERLQTTIEELEASNEDVRSANEELQAANEELQSINEELETSQEELQSANEELVTINVEFQNQITELTQRNNDIHNLLTGTEIATIFLDLELKIKLYTNHINKIISLIPSDVGRPLADLDNKLQYDRLLQDIEQVLQSLQITEIEVQDKEDNWYNLRILPYRTTNNAIDGVVLTFININGQKEKERQEQRLRYMEQIVGTLPIPLLVLDHRLSVFVANQAFYEQFQLARDEVEDRLFYEVADGAWYNEKMRTLLEQIIPSNNRIEDFAVEAVFADGQQWSMTINARRLIHADEGVELILLFIENVRQMNEAGLEKWPEVAANQPEDDAS